MPKNPFDQFDTPAGNNPFDTFDSRPNDAPTRQNAAKRKREWGMSDVIKEPVKIAGEMAAGAANLPVKIAKGYKGLYATAKKALQGGSLDDALRAGTEAIGNTDVITSPYPSKTMQTLGEHIISPVINKTAGVLGVEPSTVSAVLEAGGDLASLMGLGAGVKSPIAAASRATKNVVGKVADATASNLANLALKQPTKLTKAQRNQNVKTMLDGNYRPTPRGTAKLDADIVNLEQQLADGFAAGSQNGVQGSLQKAVDNVDALRKQALASSDPVGNLKRIDDSIGALQTHPLANNGMVDLADLQQMKVAQGRELHKTYGEPQHSFQNLIDKARVRGMKEELESIMQQDFPELSSVNGDLAKLYQLKKVLDPAANRVENSSTLSGLGYKAGMGGIIGNAIPGIGPAVGGAVGTAIGLAQNPFVGPRVAGLLNKVNGKQPQTYIVPDNLPVRGGLMTGSLIDAILRGDKANVPIEEGVGSFDNF